MAGQQQCERPKEASIVKTAIVYHSSHHGNTKKLVDAIAQDHDVDLIDASAQKHADLGQYDLIGFASGIYGGSFHPDVLGMATNDMAPGEGGFLSSIHDRCGRPPFASAGVW